MSEIDNAETITTLALGDPSLIPPAFVDVIDAITNLEPGLGSNCRTGIVDQIFDELTTDHMEIIKTIAALVELHQVATGRQTFSEWLATPTARRISGGLDISILMHEDPDWPRDARTHAEFRDYIVENHKFASGTFEHVWGYYRSLALAPYGDTGTTRTEIQYAARIAWNSGYDEIHPDTVNGTSRFKAEGHVRRYNDRLLIDVPNSEDPGSSASASVVQRTVIYGPWYAI